MPTGGRRGHMGLVAAPTRAPPPPHLLLPLLLLSLCVAGTSAADPAATVAVNPPDITVPAGTAGYSAAYLTNVRPAPPGTAPSEDGQVLCSGAGICPCTVVNSAGRAGTPVTIFADPPHLVLSSNVPTEASPATAELVFRLRVPVPAPGFPQVTEVQCEVTDDEGGVLRIPSFVVMVTGLTWTPLSSVVTCVEDQPCGVDPFYTNLIDNNGGGSSVAPGGAWYTISSTDPRMTLPEFFDTPPTLSTYPTSACLANRPGAGGCASGITMSFFKDVNTDGTWGGRTGPIVFNITIVDALGNRAEPQGISVVVGGVNDRPTVTLNTPALEATYMQGRAGVGALQHVYDNVVTAAAPGPPSALDEAQQGFAPSQPCSTDAAAAAFFDVQPSLDLTSGTNALLWTFKPMLPLTLWGTDPITMAPVPAVLTLSCAVTDSGVASTVLNDITVTVYPENALPTVACATMCAQTINEVVAAPAGGKVIVRDYFTTDPSTPVGLAWETQQKVTAVVGGCVVTQTCTSSKSAPNNVCLENFEVVPGSSSSRWSVQFDPVLHAVGAVDFTCAFEDALGGRTDAPAAQLTFTEVNTAPTGILRRGRQHSSSASSTAVVTVTNFLDLLRPGEPGSVSENAEVLSVACTIAPASAAMTMFTTPPGRSDPVSIILAPNNNPTDAAPVAGTLEYQFAAGVTAGSSATVTCSVSDSAMPASIWTVPTFTITATDGPEFTVSTALLECDEDTSVGPATAAARRCSFPNLLTDLVDNNGGMSTFASVNCPPPCTPDVDPCPASPNVGGGGATFAAQCWYSFTSTDTRFFSSEFFQVRPYFVEPAPAGCVAPAVCTASLQLQLAANANTGDIPLPLVLTVQDTVGNAVVRELSLVVAPVNDHPTIGASEKMGTASAVLETITLPFLSGVRPGPVKAADEDGQVITASCVSNPNAVFESVPEVVFESTTPTHLIPTPGQLRFTLSRSGTIALPQTVTVACTVEDDQNGVATLPPYALEITPGPPAFTAARTEVTLYEDNSETATPVSAGPVTVAGFLEGITDMSGGTVGFPSTMWYDLSSTDPRFSTMFKNGVLPTLSPPSPAPCAAGCTSDITFTLADNFATTQGNPVIVDVRIKNANGVSATQQVHLNVEPVNDVPVFTLMGNITLDYTAEPVVYPQFFTGIAPGPVGSGEGGADGQRIVEGACTLVGGASSGVAVSPLGVVLDFANAMRTADLSFSLTDPIPAFPTPPERVRCDFRDSEGALASADFTVTVRNGPTNWMLPTPPNITVNEDGRATASNTSTPITIPNVVTELRDNGQGAAAFNEAVCGTGGAGGGATPAPADRCWYLIRSTVLESNLGDPAGSGGDAVYTEPPRMGMLQCTAGVAGAGGVCTADMTFTLQSNFAGRVRMDISVYNVYGYEVPVKSAHLTVLPVDDRPTGRLREDPMRVGATFNILTPQVKDRVVVDLSPGPGETADWSGLSTTCVHNGRAAWFAANGAPVLTLGEPDTRSAALRYQLAGTVDRASMTVSCRIIDTAGASNFEIALPDFVLEIEPPTPAPPVTLVPLTNLPTTQSPLTATPAMGMLTATPPLVTTLAPPLTPVRIPERENGVPPSSDDDDDGLAWGWWFLFWLLVAIALIAAAGTVYYFAVVRPKAENINAALANRELERRTYTVNHDYVGVDEHGNPLATSKPLSTWAY